MQRVTGSTATKDNKFTQGDALNGIEATIVTAEWLNSVQEEICNAIEDEKIPLDLENSKQLNTAISSKINKSSDSLMSYIKSNNANFLTKNDLKSYAQKEDLNNYAKSTDLNSYLKESDLPKTEFMKWTIACIETLLHPLKYPNYPKK